MPTIVPSPDAIVVDDFSSSLHPVASFILRRNNTNTPPTRHPHPPPNHANHDEPAAARAASSPTPPPSLQRTPTQAAETTWAGIARTNHRNPQHVPYAEGRGPSSKRRYRKRATRRRLLTTNTLSPLLSLSLSLPLTGIHHKSTDIHSRTLATLRRIHNKHHSILIPSTKDNIETQHEPTTDTERLLEHTLAEFNALSTLFDNTAERIEQSMEHETNTTSEHEFNSQFNHTFILPIEAALQYALDDFTTHSNAILFQHELTLGTIHNNKSTANQISNFNIYDDDSIDADNEPNTTELEQLYNRDNTTTIPPTINFAHQPSLVELLQRYEKTQHQPRNTTHERRIPILPPWNHEETTSQHRTNQTTLPILPPITTIPPIPEVPPPTTWTTSGQSPRINNIAEPHQCNHRHQPEPDIDDEYIEYDTNNQYARDLHEYDHINNTTTNTTDANTTQETQESHNNNNNNNPMSHEISRPRQNRRTNTTLARKVDRNFTNKLTIVTQNIRGLPIDDDTKLQSLIHQMKEHNWAAVCIQETWRLGEDDFYIDGHRVLMQGPSKKINELGHVMGGVCIILNPEMDAAHKLALNKKINLPNDHKYEGRFLGVQLHFKRRDSHGKRIKGTIKTILCSIYHPVDSSEHEEFNGITQTLVNRLPTDTQMIFGQDINCNVGITSDRNDPLRSTLGPHGINNRNTKGAKFLQHLCSLNMKLANSYFIKPNYTTWKNFRPSRPSFHMLDVFSVSSPFFKHILDCGTIPFGVDNTDHTATAIVININCIASKNYKRHNAINGGRADWSKIAHDPTTKQQFNSTLTNELQHTDTSDDYTTFFEIVGNSAKSTAIKTEDTNRAWFEMSKTTLQPTIDRVTALLHASRDPTNPDPAKTKRELHLAYRLRNIAVRNAKSRYMSHIAEKISTLTGDNTRSMWEAINECKLGHENNYSRPQTMALLKDDGTKTTNDKENIAIMRSHCEKLFNNKKVVSPDALDLIDQRNTETDLDNPITWKEFTKAINGLKNNKSPGSNEIPAEAFKAMNNKNRNHIFSFINAFWNNTADYPEWHAGLGIPVQKVAKPTNPNQYRIVNLMDVASKIFSRILTARLYKLLHIHGTKYQFGATPNAGCQDANYTLKTLLHLRRQHNKETFVVFADLVKAFDTSDHILISDILKKYGAPPKISSAIERLYSDLHVTLKIGKETTDIDQTVGVRQGDNLSPIIFLFVMTAFSEILDKKWKTAGIAMVEAEHTPLSELEKGQLTGHTRPAQKRGTSTHVTQTLFLDDSGFPFETREDAAIGTKLVRETFASLGLEMHCGTKDSTKSKTEILWIPAPSFYTDAAKDLHRNATPTLNAPTAPATSIVPFDPTSDTSDEIEDDLPLNELSIGETTKQTQPLTFCTMSMKQREELYWQSPKTNRILLDDDGSFIDFTAHFKYLGSFISFDLTDDMDIKLRITKVNQAMSALRHFWRNPYVDLKAKKLVFLAIPANLLLWGCETWALRQSHIRKLNVFWHRAIRNILGIRMQEVIDDKISNEQIRKIFFDIPDAETVLNAKAMNYLGKTARSPDTHPPKLLMTAWIKNPRPKSGVLSSNKKATVRSLNALLPEETRETITRKCKTTGATITIQRQNPNGSLSNWLHLALDKQLWDWYIYKLLHPNAPTPPRPDPARPRQPTREENEESQDSYQPNNNSDNSHRHNRTHTNNRRHRNTTDRQHSNDHQPPDQDPRRNHTRTNYDPTMAGRTRTDSIRALGLELNATSTEIKHRFRTLSLIYHPDKYDESLGIRREAATAHFQTLNNAYTYLRETA